MSARILVIEDEKSIQIILRNYLEGAGYEVILADNGRVGLEKFNQQPPDLIILDLNLPEMDGLEVAAELRKQSDVYILMLTARVEEEDRITGLTTGADDYLTKPFSPREMVARVGAILRRNREKNPVRKVYRSAHISLDFESHEVFAADVRLDLTATEFDLLSELIRHPGIVLSRARLLAAVWGDNYFGNDRVVDVYVGQVRRKIQDAIGRNVVETVRGIGYKFVDEV